MIFSGVASMLNAGLGPSRERRRCPLYWCFGTRRHASGQGFTRRVPMHGEGAPVDELVELRKRVEQLQHALHSRIVIEQAKGILAERFGLSIDDAFALLRFAARSSRQKIHVVANEVVASPLTPPAVVAAVAREQQWRAARRRGQPEMHCEKTEGADQLHLSPRS